MFERIVYEDLNARQKENYNFQKVAARLSDYGFNCMRLTDDWEGADFIACHINGQNFLKVQLKGRMYLDKKYMGKNVYIAFIDGQDCYVYPHDDVMEHVETMGKINDTVSWAEKGAYSWPQIPHWARPVIDKFKI